MWGLILLQLLQPTIQLFMSAFTSKYKSTPTFTFKGKSKSVTTYNDPALLPSPQLYNPEKIASRKMPDIAFPKSIRKQWQEIKSKQMLPGPGAHQAKSYITDGQKRTISKSLFIHQVPLTPSPSQYNADVLKLQKKQPSFTMQKKTISMHDLLADKNRYTPSPGRYEQPILNFRSSSSMQVYHYSRSIGKAKRKSIANLDKIPGPGSYQMEKSYSSLLSSSSKCKLGKSQRKIDFAIGEKSPGPGSYEKKTFIQQNKTKQRGYSCRAKYQQIISTKTPGPGQYETPIIKRFKSSPSIKMAKSVRLDFIDKSVRNLANNPGPGSFNHDDGDKMKFRSMSVNKFSKSKVNYLTQSFKSQISENLGPGSYNANDSFLQKKAPKFSISLNRDRGLFKKIADMPGPGLYNPKTQLLHQSQFTHKLQTSKRPNVIKHLANLPGPSQYQFDINERLGRKFKFSKEKRVNFVQDKIRKQISSTHETFQERQQFPNPPKYMCVQPKMKINQKNMKKYV